MKKNLFNRFAVIIVTALLTFTTANSFAGNTKQLIQKNFPAPPRDTPYLAMVQINTTGFGDTPYVSFSIKPQLVYKQVNGLLGFQTGYFHVLISFVNIEGVVVKEDDYYIDNR